MLLTDTIRRYWRDQSFARSALHVHLAPGELAWLEKRGDQPVANTQGRLSLSTMDGHWQAALAALHVLLDEDDHKHRLPLAISVASRWWPVLMAPWSDALLREPQAGQYLKTQMATQYGEPARSWHVTADDAAYGGPRLVSGIDAALLQGLREAAREHGRRCLSIEPLLSAAWQHMGKAGMQALALLEPGRLLLAASSRGRIYAIHMQPCSGTWLRELPQAWQRWTLRRPELARIAQVAVLNMSSETIAAALLPALGAQFRMLDAPGLPGWQTGVVHAEPVAACA
ncbi:hypothetical protein [Pseudoduganella violacea]|uniref:Uncharacterized protein n=1 Tax=Pseudoduganella violacea TaxID=1715466 RepID=A0A7W5BCD5_9BURK|nr:hypothetical protein [Pseudoduganella violacea]MBB3120597.1 hypothetical protein [Pseudoduganella violacea]